MNAQDLIKMFQKFSAIIGKISRWVSPAISHDEDPATHAAGLFSVERPAGRDVLRTLPAPPSGCHLVVDRAYEGNETRQLALDLGFEPVVPPHPLRVSPWLYNKAVYRRRNEIERLFRRLKGFWRILSRFDKLDVMFAGFIHFALIIEALR